MTTAQRRFALGAALLVALAPVLLAQSSPAFKAGETKTFDGKGLPLADLLKGVDAKLDPEAVPHWLALVTDDGKVYPLIRDDGAKMFFTDAKVRNKKVRITGRLFADTHLLQVLNVHSFKGGQLCEIYY